MIRSWGGAAEGAYNGPVSWTLYVGAIAFFTALTGVFLMVAYSVLLGVYDNYLRYYQKAELQWTGTERRSVSKNIPFFRLILLAFLLAWFLVHFVVMP